MLNSSEQIKRPLVRTATTSTGYDSTQKFPDAGWIFTSIAET